ncbi:MAG TPA: aspartyl protease family protein [Dehalococcoidia bacterium]
MARTIVYEVTYPFLPANASTRHRPKVPVRLMHPTYQALFMDMDMLVDSGADVTSLPLGMAGRLGINLANLQQHQTRGVGGVQTSYYCPNLVLSLAGVIVSPCPVSFTTTLNEALLGREGVFDQFAFGFEQSTWCLHVQLPHPSSVQFRSIPTRPVVLRP